MAKRRKENQEPASPAETTATPFNTVPEPAIKQPVEQNSAAMAAALEEVIDRLQLLMRESMLRSEEEVSFRELVDYMEKFSRASTRLAALLKAQQAAAQGRGKKSNLQVAMEEVLVSMGKKVE